MTLCSKYTKYCVNIGGCKNCRILTDFNNGNMISGLECDYLTFRVGIQTGLFNVVKIKDEIHG